MGRKRLKESELKERIAIRLPKWIIDKIEKLGTKQTVIEKLIRDNLHKYDKD